MGKKKVFEEPIDIYVLPKLPEEVTQADRDKDPYVDNITQGRYKLWRDAVTAAGKDPDAWYGQLAQSQTGTAGGVTTPTAGTTTTPATDTTTTPVTASPYFQQAMEEYSAYKPELAEYSVAAPEKSDYERTQDWYNTYFPTISQEEQDKRESQIRNDARWQLFGNAAASIANAIGSWNGGTPVNIPDAKYPDLTTWRRQLNSERKAKAAQEDADRKAYTSAYNTWLQGKNTYDRYNMKRMDEWQTAVAKRADNLQTQAWKEKQEEQKQKNAMDQIQKRGEEARLTRTTTPAKAASSSSGGGGGSSSSGGGHRGSSGRSGGHRGSSGNSIDSMSPEQVNAAFANAVKSKVIKKDYNNSKDVGAKRAALKKAYGKSKIKTGSSHSGGGNAVSKFLTGK